MTKSMGRPKTENRSIPPELIFEILSRLPIEDLTRVQLVSKEWQSLTHDHYLINNHMARSPVVYHMHNESVPSRAADDDDGDKGKRDSYRFMHDCDGVLLLLNVTTNKYFMWNPEISRVLDLPDPHPGNIGLAMMYVSATRGYRIVSVHKHEGQVGCEVLTPGPNMSWKPLQFPDDPNSEKVLVVPIGKDVHFVLVTKEDAVEMIVTLHVPTESFTVNHVPSEDVSTAVLNWDGKLGFVNVVGKTLEVLILENCEEKKWGAEKTIIPLPFVDKPGFEGGVRPLFNRGGDIWFWLEGKEIFSYTIETGKIVKVKDSKAMSSECGLMCSYKKSLLRFEGMRPDEDVDLHDYRPRKSSSSYRPRKSSSSPI